MSNISRLVNLAAAGAGGSAYWAALLGGADNDLFRSVAVDSSNNIIASGYTSSDGAGSNDALVAKYDASGSTVWSKTLGGTSYDFYYSVCLDSSDNIYTAGTSNRTTVGNDGLLSKYNSSGTLLWSVFFGGSATDQFHGVTVDSANNVIVVGNSFSNGFGSSDVIIVKYNSSGTLLWNVNVGGSGPDYGRSVAVDSSDNIIAVGFSNTNSAGSFDLFITKISSSGAMVWNKNLGGSFSDRAFSVAVDSSDNIIAVGLAATGSSLADNDALVVKYNSSGTLLWSKSLGGAGDDAFNAVALDSSDDIICAGYTKSSGAGLSDALLAKYDSSGTFLWSRVFGGTGDEVGNGVALDANGSIIFAGITDSGGAGIDDGMLAKVPSDGSGTGVYGPFTYQNVTLTNTSVALTTTPNPSARNSPSYTAQSATLTDATAVLTEAFYEITP